MMTSFYITAVVATCIYFAEGQSTCNTPSGGEGECINIRQCNFLITLFANKSRSAQHTAMLKNSYCGYDEKIPKVCCPSPCRTPEGKPGQCVNIENCRHLAVMNASVQEGNKEYLETSRCEGADEHTVCCGPHPGSPSRNCTATISAYPPSPRSKCCGNKKAVVGPMITGGMNTDILDHPWLVLIEYVLGDQIHTSCGGSLISGKYVLTAAHCVHGPQVHGPPTNIRLGEYDTSNEGPDSSVGFLGVKITSPGAVVIPIERVIPHPAYSSSFVFYTISKHDIALIRMVRAAPYTDFIRPICLPSKDLTVAPPDNFILLAAGWGAISAHKNNSNIKQQVALPYVDLQTCQAVYNIKERYAELASGQVCAGGDAGKDSCSGDSGGPLMYARKGIAEIVGVVSFGHTECGTYGVPAVYTKVFKYIGWIRNNILP